MFNKTIIEKAATPESKKKCVRMLQFPTLETISKKNSTPRALGDVEQNNKSTHSLAGGDLNSANPLSRWARAVSRY